MSSLEDNIQGLRRVVVSITGLPLANVVLDYSDRRQSQNPSGLYSVITLRSVHPIGKPEVYDDIRQEAVVVYDISFIGEGATSTAYKMLAGQFGFDTQNVMREYSIGFKTIDSSNGTNHLQGQPDYIEAFVVECKLWATLVTTSEFTHIDELEGLNITDENNNPIG